MYQILKVVGKKVQVRDRERGHRKVQVRDRERGHSAVQALREVHMVRVHDRVRDVRVGDGEERDDKVRDDAGQGVDDVEQDVGGVGHGVVSLHEVSLHEYMGYGTDQHLIHKIWLELGNPHYTNGHIRIFLG